MSNWKSRIALAFVAWLAVATVVRVFGGTSHPVVVALYVAVGAVLLWLFLEVSADAETARWPKPREEPIRDPGEDPRLDQLRRVVGQHLDSREVGDAMHRHLTQLADRRLMARHGITRDADPDGAARLLGPELSSVAAAHAPYPRLTTAQIDLLLRRIEEL